MLNFYNKFGNPIAYTDDNTHLFSFNGAPLAYFSGAYLYTFSGKHIGFFVDGWIRDINGYCVFFCENAIGGMAKPLKHLLPLKSLKRLVPLKSLRQMPRTFLVKRFAWSNYSNSDFFNQ